MSNKDILDNIKKLRELTGVGFKDCKSALDENNGNIEKSIEFLRKKGIAKATKKMNRTAAEGLVLVKENKGYKVCDISNGEEKILARINEGVNWINTNLTNNQMNYIVKNAKILKTQKGIL